MGTWDWDAIKKRQIVDVNTAPEAVRLVRQIHPDDDLDQAFEDHVEKVTGLPQLSLLEWPISDNAPEIFGLLREAGSSKGYVSLPYGDASQNKGCFEISLSDDNAIRVCNDGALDWVSAFVDEQMICSIVSYHSDYALVGMRADLLDHWVTMEHFDLTLWADEAPFPKPKNYKEAQAIAARRLVSWDRVMNRAEKP